VFVGKENVRLTQATPRRILIADDEPLIRLDLREMLTALGYQVVGEASDGATAVRLARETRPDIVIMDIQMPEQSGLDAAQILTAENIAPVLLLTAYSQKELVRNSVWMRASRCARWPRRSCSRIRYNSYQQSAVSHQAFQVFTVGDRQKERTSTEPPEADRLSYQAAYPRAMSPSVPRRAVAPPFLHRRIVTSSAALADS
jgi:CheY-like chemotaxis protein